MNSKDPPSKILLIIITQLPPSFPLTNDYLHSVFSKYGDIKKILIFERGKANKCFVEYHSIQSAQAARKDLFGKYIAYCGGKMQIHFSRLKNLDLQVVDQSRGTEYSSNRVSSKDDFYSYNSQCSMATGLTHSKTDDPNLLSQQLSQLKLADMDQEIPEFQQVDQVMKQQVEKFLDDDYENEMTRYPQKQTMPMQNQMTIPNQMLPQMPFPPLMQQQQWPPNLMDTQQIQSMTPLQQQVYLSQLQQQQLQIFQNMYMQQMLQQQQQQQQQLQQQKPSPPPSLPKQQGNARNDEINNLIDDDDEEEENTSSLNNNTKQTLWRNYKDDDKQDQLSLSSKGSSKQDWRSKEQSQVQKLIKNADISAILTQKPSKTLSIYGVSDKVSIQMANNLFSNFGNIDSILNIRTKGRMLIQFQFVDFATIAKELLNNFYFFGQQLRIHYHINEMLTPNLGNEEFQVIPPSSHKIGSNQIYQIISPSNQILIQTSKKVSINDLKSLISEGGEIEDLTKTEQEQQYLATMKDISDALQVVALYSDFEFQTAKLNIKFFRKNK